MTLVILSAAQDKGRMHPFVLFVVEKCVLDNSHPRGSRSLQRPKTLPRAQPASPAIAHQIDFAFRPP